MSYAQEKKFLRFIFTLALVLRVILAVLNSESNDDHFPVIHLIMQENRLPTRDECWECFQPKLYHATVALTLNTLGVDNPATQIRVAQLINVLAGIITLIVVARFLEKRQLHPHTRLLAFALIALNPRLIAINIQATNDTFAILFTTLTIYHTYRYIQSHHTTHFLYLALFATLSTLTKGSGLINFVAIILIFTIHTLTYRPRPAYLRPTIILIIGFIFASYGGQYIYNYCTYGTPLVTNATKKPLPALTEPTWAGRPGIVSIKASYLTFRLPELLQTPQINYDMENYPWHRTSLWTQLYGRLHALHFDPWPPTWASPNPLILWLLRAIFTLALLPSLLFALGILVETHTLWQRLRRQHSSLLSDPTWTLHIFGLGYIAFIILYTLQYRDIATMKAIFILPALLSFTHLFTVGYEKIRHRLTPTKLMPLLNLCLLLLLCFYTADILMLILELPFYELPPHINRWAVAPLSPKMPAFNLICQP